MNHEYKYIAFISYKREDEKWAKWLQFKLEHYKLPTLLRKINPSLPERVRPIFKGTFIIRLELDYQKAIKDTIGSSEYYPNHRDSLKTDQWYMNIATMVISQSLKE